MAKLLLLDDDPETLAWVAAALEGRGHEVRAFTSGRAALQSLGAWTPELIISDIVMPEMDGIAFARLVARRAPLMFVSIAKREAEAVLAGASGYVQKPATAQELRDAVERALGRSTSRNTLLLVDDDRDLRELYRMFLEPRFALLEAQHGAEALEILRRQPVDLAIVDVHMPVMNGVELIRQLRADPAFERLPIIVQTSDRLALQAPVWRELQVSQRMDKTDFLDWLFSKVDQHAREASFG